MRSANLRKLLSLSLAVMMLVPMTGTALTTGLTAYAAAGGGEVNIPDDNGDNGNEAPVYQGPQNFTVTVDSMPVNLSSGLVAGGFTTNTLSWDDMPDVDMGEMTVMVTISTGEDKYLLDYDYFTMCRAGEYVPPQYAWTVENGRASFRTDLPTLGENEAQIVDGDYVNGIKDGDTVKIFIWGTGEDDLGNYCETEPSDTVAYPAVADSEGKTFPTGQDSDKPDIGWAVPNNVKVYIDTMPFSTDGSSLVPGVTQNYVSWSNDPDVYCYEVKARATSPDGRQGWLVDFSVPREMIYTDENGINHYCLQYDVVAPEDQVFEDGWVNGGAEGDEIEVFVSAVVKFDNSYYVAESDEGVAYTLLAENYGAEFPETIVPVAPDETIPKNFKATPIVIPTNDDGLVTTGTMLVELTWDNNAAVNEGEVFVKVTTVGGNTYWLYPAWTIIRATGEGGGMVEWTTGSDNRNIYILPVPTLAPGEEQVIDADGVINGVREGDTVEICSCAVVYTDGMWLMSDPSRTVSFEATYSNLNVTFPQPEPEPETPKNVKVVINSMERGTMIADHFGELEGTVVNMSVSFDKQQGLDTYFVAPLKGEDHYKVATGNMPFIVATGAGSYWNSGEGGSYVGPNGETITLKDGRITVEVNVMMFDTAPAEPWLGYVEGESIIMCVMAESYEHMMSSDAVLVPVPCSESSIGITYPRSLANLSELDRDTITLGETFTAECAASGGVSPYQYEVKYKKATSEKYTTIQPYSSYDLITLKPAAAVAYDVQVNVKDANGDVVSKEFRVNVCKPLENTSTLSAQAIIIGDTITINASAKGGKAPYKYEVSYKKATSEKYTKVQSYKSNKTVTIKPSSAVAYDIRVNVMDSLGNVTTKDFRVSVNKPLTNESTISANVIEFGGKVKIRGVAKGGIGAYSFAYFYKKSSTSTWYTLADYSENNVVIMKPGSAVNYDIRVAVKDETGTVVNKDLTLRVTKDLSNDSVISKTTAAKKEEVKVSGRASGGTEPYEFAFYYKKASRSDWHQLFDYSDKNVCTISFNVATKYDIRVDIRDAEGTVVSKTFTVQVT